MPCLHDLQVVKKKSNLWETASYSNKAYFAGEYFSYFKEIKLFLWNIIACHCHFRCFYFFSIPYTIQLTRLICTFVLLSIEFKVPPDFIMYWHHKWMLPWLHKIPCYHFKKNIFYENYIYSLFLQKKKIITQIYKKKFQKISCYPSNKGILWKLYLFYFCSMKFIIH